MRICGNCNECQAKDCPRRLRSGNGFSVVSDFAYEPRNASGVFCDIGTTTIASVRCDNGKIIKKDLRENPQRRFGADVLSRIGIQNRAYRDEVIAVLQNGVDASINAVGGGTAYVSGNTAMVNMYLGRDCSGMGAYPFIPPSLDGCEENGIVIPPQIGAFLGADVVAGLYMCDFYDSDEINILVDLGTNAEIAIGNRNKILLTSAAAGPAFEGGEISCGVGSVEGAISFVSLKTGTMQTIGNKPPVGLCGTGIIDLMSELLRVGKMDKTGRIDEDYAIADGIAFTQRDVRQVQMAKGAVRTALEILLREYGAEPSEVANVYVAGGFGKYLNFDNACRIGLLPNKLKGKYEAVGNSSLGGIIKLAENSDGMDKMRQIKAVSEIVQLTDITEFNDLFIENMNF